MPNDSKVLCSMRNTGRDDNIERTHGQSAVNCLILGDALLGLGYNNSCRSGLQLARPIVACRLSRGAAFARTNGRAGDNWWRRSQRKQYCNTARPWVVTPGRNQDTEAAGRETSSVLCAGSTNTVATWANVQELDS